MDIQQTLAEMALELEHHRTRDAVMRRVSEYAVEILGADDAGILMMEGRQQLVTPAATSPLVDRVHQMQADLGEGPCLDAIAGRATHLANDVANDPRWPVWGPAAAEIGIASAVGVRIATRDRGYGSLNVFSKSRDAFTETSAEIVEMLAAHVTAAIAASHREEGLMTALETRTIIGQAQGILMQKFGIDADTAFSYLRRMSQHENVRLTVLAEAIAVQRDANARPE